MVSSLQEHRKEGERHYKPLHSSSVSAAEEPELKKFQPTAASAALLEKFVNPSGSLIEDVAELAEAYNDLVFLRKIADIKQEIDDEDDPEAKKKLEGNRDAMLKLIQSRDVKELIK